MPPLDITAAQEREEARIQKLQAFAEKLAETRTEAVEARKQSGIEQEWQEDEDHYNGQDELTRSESDYLKGASPNSPLTTVPAKTPAPTKSTIFMNITQTYVDMAAASVADMLLPTDDMPFAVLPMPEPELHAAMDSMEVLTNRLGQQTTVGDAAKKMLAEAKESADKAQDIIWDWLTEAPRGHGGGWHAEARKLINQAARKGSSVLKGPFPVRRRAKKIQRDQQNRLKVTLVESLSPTSKQIDPDNLFPDPACGENIHDGSYVWERDKITTRGLRDLKEMRDPEGNPMYLVDQIDEVLREGPNKKYEGGAVRDSKTAATEPYEIWYFHGVATKEELEACGCNVPEGTVVPVMITMVNERVIAATRPTLDSGDFPYDVLVWQRVPGRVWGRSEARKVRTPQRLLVAAVRAMNDNAGLASGPQIIIDSESIYPADGLWQITPRKVWRKKQGAPIDDITKAMHVIKIDIVQAELLEIIKFALEMADKCATMPIQQQGQQGVTQETAEGRRLLQNNASVQKRALAKIFDDDITEPHVGRYYEYLLLYSDNEDAKREFVIDARGSTALFERDAENMAVAQIGAFVKDPAYGLDPKRWAAEYLRSNKLDPERFKYTEEEEKAMAEQAAKNPPVDPKIAVEKIRQAGELADIRARAQDAAQQRIADAAEAAKQRVHEMAVAQLEYEKQLADFAHEKGITLDEAKVDLTKVVMELRTQKELAGAANAAKTEQARVKGSNQGQRRGGRPRPAPQVAPTAVEPPGRAPDGEAFQK